LGTKQLLGVKQDLTKIMVLVSDGQDTTRVDPAIAAQVAKDQGITIFAVGFSDANLNQMRSIAGNKDNSCGDACVKKTSSLPELKRYMETEFCREIITVLPPSPPTPAPTQLCGADRSKNTDAPWEGCIGDLCNVFWRENGSSEACLYYKNLGQCGEDFMERSCHCTCGRCCDLTPEPTPTPTETPTPAPTVKDSTRAPTASPTQAPTMPDCEPDFKLGFTSTSAWLTGEQTLRDFFNQFCYDFDEDWPNLIADFSVKVVRNDNKFRFDSPDGIWKHPFEPFNLTICMPEDFPRCGPKDSAHRLPFMLFSSLLLLLTVAW